ncbi:MAG: hypothetical protein WC860_10020, partial [Candidatus Margulisiibacteriota bacterium]
MNLKKKLKFIFLLLIFLILPLLFFSWGLALQKASGPNYLSTSYRGQHFDPEYAYLFNALNVIHGQAPWHIDHPGTPLQVLGAMVLKVQHPFENPAFFENLVFTEPEICLFQINLVINIMIFSVIFALGFVTFWVTKQMGLALIMQLSPLISLETMLTFSRVTPEPLLLSVTLLLVLILVTLLKFDLKQHLKSYLFLFSILIGFALALKISYFPLLLIPGILFLKERKLWGFIFYAMISFFVFTLPIITRYKSIVGWVLRLGVH